MVIRIPITTTISSNDNNKNNDHDKKHVQKVRL